MCRVLCIGFGFRICREVTMLENLLPLVVQLSKRSLGRCYLLGFFVVFHNFQSPLGSDRCKGVLRTKTLGRRVMAGRPSTRGEIPWQVSFLVNFLEDCRLRTKKFHYANSRGVFKK
uniref:Uncharacterized protein n=1 Tax=Cacopsylla melanoneura TaxID=428564 RepID=A0A8D8WLG6_9HEMI